MHNWRFVSQFLVIHHATINPLSNLPICLVAMLTISGTHFLKRISFSLENLILSVCLLGYLLNTNFFSSVNIMSLHKIHSCIIFLQKFTLFSRWVGVMAGALRSFRHIHTNLFWSLYIVVQPTLFLNCISNNSDNFLELALS